MRFTGNLGKIKDLAYHYKEKVQGFPTLHRYFQRYNQYPLKLWHPETNNEHIVHKMVFDRNPLLVLTSDKVKVRDYVRQVLGHQQAEEILIPVFHISKVGRDFPDSIWKEEFFMKANHGSGMNLLVQPGDDRQQVYKLAQEWLSVSYGQEYHSWAYRDIPRRIICEKVIRDSQDKIPMDIKLYCFHGKVKMVLFYKDRFETPCRIFSDQFLNPITGVQSNMDMLDHVPQYPAFPKMLTIAEKLAKPFTYARIDLYSLEDKVFFGEITHYTGAGIEKLDSYEIDWALGLLWKKENIHKNLSECLEEILSTQTRNIPVSPNYSEYPKEESSQSS